MVNPEREPLKGEVEVDESYIGAKKKVNQDEVPKGKCW